MATKIFKPVSLLNDGRFDEFIENISEMSTDDIRVCFGILIEKYKSLKTRFGLDNERALDQQNETIEETRVINQQEKIFEQQQRIKRHIEDYSSEIEHNNQLKNDIQVLNENSIKNEELLNKEKTKHTEWLISFEELQKVKNNLEDQLNKEMNKCRKLHELCSEEMLKNQNLRDQLTNLNMHCNEVETKADNMKSDNVDANLLIDNLKRKFDVISRENVFLKKKIENTEKSNNEMLITEESAQNYISENLEMDNSKTSLMDKNKNLEKKIEQVQETQKFYDQSLEDMNKLVDVERTNGKNLKDKLSFYEKKYNETLQNVSMSKDFLKNYEDNLNEEFSKKSRLHDQLAEEIQKSKSWEEKYNEEIKNTYGSENTIDKLKDEKCALIQANQEFKANENMYQKNLAEMVREIEEYKKKNKELSEKLCRLKDEFKISSRGQENDYIRESSFEEDRSLNRSGKLINTIKDSNFSSNNFDVLKEDLFRSLDTEKKKNESQMCSIISEQKQNNELIDLYTREQQKNAKLIHVQSENKIIYYDLLTVNEQQASNNEDYIKKISDMEKNLVYQSNQSNDNINLANDSISVEKISLNNNIQELKQKLIEKEEIITNFENLQRSYQRQVEEQLEVENVLKSQCKELNFDIDKLMSSNYLNEEKYSKTLEENCKFKEDLEYSDSLLKDNEDNFKNVLSTYETKIINLHDELINSKINNESMKNFEEVIQNLNQELESTTQELHQEKLKVSDMVSKDEEIKEKIMSENSKLIEEKDCLLNQIRELNNKIKQKNNELVQFQTEKENSYQEGLLQQTCEKQNNANFIIKELNKTILEIEEKNLHLKKLMGYEERANSKLKHRLSEVEKKYTSLQLRVGTAYKTDDLNLRTSYSSNVSLKEQIKQSLQNNISNRHSTSPGEDIRGSMETYGLNLFDYATSYDERKDLLLKNSKNIDSEKKVTSKTNEISYPYSAKSFKLQSDSRNPELSDNLETIIDAYSSEGIEIYRSTPNFKDKLLKDGMASTIDLSRIPTKFTANMQIGEKENFRSEGSDLYKSNKKTN